MKLQFLFATTLAIALASSGASMPEPGPENGGLRLRFVVTPENRDGKEVYNVQIDLLNVTNRPITLTAEWRHEGNGDYKEYFESAISIITEPPIAPWLGQIAMGRRSTSQPEYVLKKGEKLHLEWQSSDRKLKNKVLNPLRIHNPRFPAHGLYSIHATTTLLIGDRKILLRSNEQLLSVGGDVAMPRYTFGLLSWCNATNRMASLSLGENHKVVTGDRFLIHTGIIGETWSLTVTNVQHESSFGTLVPCDGYGNDTPEIKRRVFPDVNYPATLLLKKQE